MSIGWPLTTLEVRLGFTGLGMQFSVNQTCSRLRCSADPSSCVLSTLNHSHAHMVIY